MPKTLVAKEWAPKKSKHSITNFNHYLFMKGIIRLFPVALAVLALASCSNEDFLGSNNEATKKNTLDLTVEHMMGEVVTRSAYVGSNNDRVWQKEDVFSVYDDELHKYDLYQFNPTSNKFELKAETNKDLDEPKFILFPADDVVNTQWKKADNSTTAWIGIPQTFNYAELDGSDPTAYVSNLPLWGTAEKDGEGVKGNVSFLTSILKIQLTNALNNAAAISIFAYEDIAGNTEKNISGLAKVVLSQNGTIKGSTEAQLETPDAGDGDYVMGNRITVLINPDNISTDKNIIYVPIIAGHYGQIKVKYYTTGEDYTDKDQGTIINTASSQGADYTYVDKEFKRATPYAGVKKEFEINASTVTMLNNALAVNTSEEFTVTDPTTEVDVDLKIPGGSNNLTLNVKKFTGTNALNIKEADAENPFTGILTLNVTDDAAGIANDVTVNLPNAAGVKINVAKADNKSLTVDAKNAAVYVVGKDWNGLTLTNADALHIGDGDATTAITADLAPIAEFTGAITVEEDATLTGKIDLVQNHKSQAITVNGTVTGAITIKSSALAASTTITVGATGKAAAAIKAEGENNNANIVVAGEAAAVETEGTGNITISGHATSAKTVTGNIEISGAPYYDAAPYAKLVTAETKGGNVTVGLTGEGAAISTSLTFLKAGKLTLNQGYIKSVIVNSATATDVVTITNGADAAYTLIGGTTATRGKFTISNGSKWNGKLVGEGIPADEANKADATTAYKAYADKNFIATATTFAELISGKNVNGIHKIFADIDLNSQKFIPSTGLNGNVIGQNGYKKGTPVISGIELKQLAQNTTTGYGLFEKTSGAAGEINNLTFDGITITTAADGGCANIGALVGLVNQNLTMSGVTVKGVDIQAKKLSYNIGGVVGSVAAAGVVEMTNVKVTDPKIEGYKALGGLIGYVNNGGKVTLAKDGTTYCVATGAVFTQAVNSAMSNTDPHLSMVGSLIGSTDSETAANVVINVAATNAPTYTVRNESTIAPLRKWSVPDGVGTKMVDIVKLPILGLTGAKDLVKVDCETADKYSVNISIAGAAAASYSNKGKLTAAPASTVKYLDYFKNY